MSMDANVQVIDQRRHMTVWEAAAVTACRMCGGSDLAKCLDLATTPLADRFVHAEALADPEPAYPLEVLLCLDCGLSQLSCVVPPEVLYQQDYPYEMSITAKGRAHFGGLAGTITQRMRLSGQALCVDIGSNVGVLLEGFQRRGCRVLGIEPASNIAAIAESRGIPTINAFFSREAASAVVAQHGRASAITATNVFAHVADLNGFMEAISLLLDDRGMFVIEAPHALTLVKNLEYDTIYHEHLSYLGIQPLWRFFGRLGYDIIDVEQVGIHGGSLRIYVARRGRWPVTSAADELVAQERAAGLYSPDQLQHFSHSVAAHRTKLVALLTSIKMSGKTLAGVSAPAKGMTLLNYCGIGRSLLEFTTEKSTLKIGRFTPGAHIPVLPDSALLERQPDYALLLAWNFAEEIMANLSEYRQRGGKFIIPIPDPVIV